MSAAQPQMLEAFAFNRCDNCLFGKQEGPSLVCYGVPPTPCIVGFKPRVMNPREQEPIVALLRPHVEKQNVCAFHTARETVGNA